MGATDEPRPLRVVIADDDPVVRRVIAAALGRDGVDVVAEAATGLDAVEAARRSDPDLVLLDVVMPVEDGLSAASRLRDEGFPGKVVLLTATDDPELVVAGMLAGASGLLSKEIDLAVLGRVLRAVERGEVALSRRATARLLADLAPRLRQAPRLRPVTSVLSDREWEVIDLVSRGRTPDQVADELVVTLDTVRSHLKSAHRKLGVHSRAEAVRAADELRRGADASRAVPEHLDRA